MSILERKRTFARLTALHLPYAGSWSPTAVYLAAARRISKSGMFQGIQFLSQGGGQ